MAACGIRDDQYLDEFAIDQVSQAIRPETVARTPWVDFLVSDVAIRSNTSVCLKVVDELVSSLPETGQAEFAKNLAAILEKEGVALDAASYRSAPPGLRIWCGATIEQSDLQSLTPWLDWAFDSWLTLLKG
jgi:phosphoserine aminotransferase